MQWVIKIERKIRKQKREEEEVEGGEGEDREDDGSECDQTALCTYMKLPNLVRESSN